jgi:DNA-binding SARP family transcriptional activator/tetratricopeptide (TPR) repeat protein
VEDDGHVGDDVRLRLLGRFRVYRGGKEVPAAAFGGRKVRTMLRVLAVRRPDLVSYDTLAHALWADRPPADPAANLNVLVNRARRALGGTSAVVTGSGGYALGAGTVDLTEFLDGVAAARRASAGGDPDMALQLASTALELWGEPLAEDADAEWARGPRDRLLRAHLDALEIAARAAAALGDPGAAASYAEVAVAAEPLRESVTLVLAQALAAMGDRAAALASLADLRRRLADELGVDPSREVADLQLRLLRGHEPPAPTGSRRPEPPPQAAAPHPTPDGPSPVPAPATAFVDLPFVGRDLELALLRDVLAGRGIAAVFGPAGIGKSRLVREALRAAPPPWIATRAFLAERAEAWGMARSLLRAVIVVEPAAARGLPVHTRSALTTILPELDDGRVSVPLDGESRRALILAGGLHVIETATRGGGVIVVDDIQWCDPSSAALLGSVLARLPRLAAILAFRSDEPPVGLLDGLRTAREVTDVSLRSLTPAAVRALVGDRELADALVTATDGSPFAIAEVLRELVARDAVLLGAGDGHGSGGRRGWPGCNPRDRAAVDLAGVLGREGQRRAIRRRAERHGDGDVLALVALLAREVSARTLAAAAGTSDRATLDVLSSLADAGLVRLGELGWATAHDLVGETVVAALSQAQRGRLHGLLARALEAENADPSEVARHCRDAGDVAAAAYNYARAAQSALDGHATREAAAQASAGIDLRPQPPLCADLLEVRSEARAAHGDLDGAMTDLHAALHADPSGHRARRLARLAMLTFGAKDVRHAADLAEMAVVVSEGDDQSRAFVLETAAIVDMNEGRADRASERRNTALDLYRRHGDARGVARILDGQAMATFLDGRITDAVAVFDRVAGLFTDSGDLLRVITPRSTRGHGLVFLGHPAAGLDEASAAFGLAVDLDAPAGQTYALWHRSEALSALGHLDEAEADARQALEIARKAAHRGWTATAYRALGIALHARGKDKDAATAFAASAETAGEDLALFACWAAARQALCAIAAGRFTDAERFVAYALATGPPLGRYEARLAAVELAYATGDPAAPAAAESALASARAGGHLHSAARLAALLG